MALSEEEVRQLAQMEAALAKEDPHLASVLRGTPHVVVNRRGALLAAIGFLAGLGLLVAGMSTHWTVSIVGFLVMLTSVVGGVKAYTMEHPSETSTTPTARVRTATSGPVRDRQRAFMAAMEEQWRRRQENGRG